MDSTAFPAAFSAATAPPASPPTTAWLDVRIFRGEGAGVHRAARRLFGRKLGLWEYAGLAGAPDNASVELGTLAGELYIEVGDPAGQVYRAIQRVRLACGGPVLVIDALHIFPRRMRRTGLGLRMFSRQLAYARRLGVRTIETRAGRCGDENGYYTWPRLGFDGPLPPEIVDALPGGMKGCRYVLDLIACQRGRLWWLEHGVTIDVAFDLAHQSLSWQSFARYVLSSGRGGAMPQS
jgi:hypothetical protein